MKITKSRNKREGYYDGIFIKFNQKRRHHRTHKRIDSLKVITKYNRLWETVGCDIAQEYYNKCRDMYDSPSV